MNLAEYKEQHILFEVDIYDAIDLTGWVKGQQVDGGPTPEKVKEHIDKIRSLLI